jgi:hypothetical protein
MPFYVIREAFMGKNRPPFPNGFGRSCLLEAFPLDPEARANDILGDIFYFFEEGLGDLRKKLLFFPRLKSTSILGWSLIPRS